MQAITSCNNFKVKKYSKLLQKKYRDKENLFIIEGVHLVQEASKAGLLVEILTATKKYPGTFVSMTIIKKLSSVKTPQPVIGICKKSQLKLVGQKILALNNVQDPGNVGTLIRTAKSFGWDGVIVQGADIYSAKVLRSAQGAIFTIPVLQTNNLQNWLKNIKIPKVGAVLDKTAVRYYDLKLKKMILILGNEGRGIVSAVKQILDFKVYIPIAFESLNVAAAGAILMNHYQN